MSKRDAHLTSDQETYRRIVSALDSGDIEQMAAALGQRPDPMPPGPLSHRPATTSRRDPKNSAGVWDRLRRLTAMFRSRRPA